MIGHDFEILFDFLMSKHLNNKPSSPKKMCKISILQQERSVGFTMLLDLVEPDFERITLCVVVDDCCDSNASRFLTGCIITIR